MDESNLVIGNTNPADSGNYTCLVQTELEHKSASARLMVMGMIPLENNPHFSTYTFAQCLCVCSKTAQIRPQTWSCQTHTNAASGSVGSPATATTTPSQVRAIQVNQAFYVQFRSFIAHVLCCRLFGAVRWWWLVAREMEKPVAVSREPQLCHTASLTFHLLRVQGHRNQWNRNESPKSSINALSEQRCTCVCFSFHTCMLPKIQQSVQKEKHYNIGDDLALEFMLILN